jgi:hypothetical protein
MSQLFTLPKEVLLKTYSYLTPKELFTLSTSGDTRLKRTVAIDALFRQNSDVATRWQLRLFELWALNPNDSIIISKKQILETINRPANNRLFGNYFGNYHISLGLSLAGNRIITGHSVRVEIQETLTDQEIAGTFEALQYDDDKDFNSALKKAEHLIETHTPFMTSSQLEYCLNEVWSLLKKTNIHPAQSSVLYMLEKLAKHIPAHHLDCILNEFKKKSLINIPVFLKIAVRLNSTQWQTIIEVTLNELENKKHPSPHKLSELIRIVSLQKKSASVHLEPLNNWIIDHLDDPDDTIKNRALIVLKHLANRMNAAQVNVLFERILDRLKSGSQFIDGNTIDQLEITISLIEPKKGILSVQPLLNYLEYHSQSIKLKPYIDNYKILELYNKILRVFSCIPSFLANEDVNRILKLILTPRERRLDLREIKLIQSLSAIMTSEQRLYSLSPLLDGPANQNYQTRDQAIQLLPFLGNQLTDKDLAPVIDWALDNLKTVHYEVKYQIPLIISALANRISVDQLNPRLAQLSVNMQDENAWVIRGAYQALETLAPYFNSKQLSPLLNWVLDATQNQQDEDRNQAMLSLLPVFAEQMTTVELAPACNLFVENLKTQNNYLRLASTIQLIPDFINLMTSEQLMFVFNWFFTGLNNTSDDNGQIIRQTLLLLNKSINAMNEKQLLVTFNLLRNTIEAIGENKELTTTKLHFNWITVLGELAKRMDYVALLPVIHWATANLEHESNHIRRRATMVLAQLSDQIEKEETGILLLNNLLSNSSCSQEHLLRLINFLFLPEAKNWQSSCDLLFTVLDNSELHHSNIYSVSGAIRSWLLNNLQENFDNGDSYIESEHFDQVLSYLKQKCGELKLQGAQNTDFLFISNIIELCIRIKSSASAEYSNRNEFDTYLASSSRPPL